MTAINSQSFAFKGKKKVDESLEYKMKKKHQETVTLCSGLVGTGFLTSFLAMKDNASLQDVLKVHDEMVKSNNLGKIGFQKYFVDFKKTPQIASRIGERSAENTRIVGWLSKKIPGIKDLISVAHLPELAQTSLGLNAFYDPISNTACAPKRKPSLLPHEIGHAINVSKYGKFLASYAPRILVGVVPALLLANAIKNDLNSNEKKPSLIKKTKNFLEEHAAGLTVLSFVPLITEEAMASRHALKAVKKVLGETKLNNFRKFYGVGLASYVVAGLTAGFAMKMAAQEKDKHINQLQAQNKNGNYVTSYSA